MGFTYKGESHFLIETERVPLGHKLYSWVFSQNGFDNIPSNTTILVIFSDF